MFIQKTFSTCTSLCNFVKPLKSKSYKCHKLCLEKSVTPEAHHCLIGSLHIICVIRSSFIYFPNMAQDGEQASVCCCYFHHDNDIFCINVVCSSINKILDWQFYLISALSLSSESHALSCGSRMASESWDLGKMAHLWDCQQPETPKKAERFLKCCWCQVVSQGHFLTYYHPAFLRGPWLIPIFI